MIGVSVVVLCLWLRFQGGFEEWLDILNAKEFYIGVYILIISSLIVIIVSFLGCISALQESSTALLGVSMWLYSYYNHLELYNTNAGH